MEAATSAQATRSATTATDNNSLLTSDNTNSLNILTSATSNSNISSAITNNVDHSQEMDIDILQVQETVTVDSDGAIIFPGKDDTISLPTDLTQDLLQVKSCSVSLVNRMPFIYILFQLLPV